MALRPIHFLRRGQVVRLDDVPADRTLLQVLREDLHCTGTKEGCNEGDCGACTVVLGEAVEDAPGGVEGQGERGQARLRLRAVNSCIRLAHSVDGMALWTVQDIHHDPLVRPARDAAAAQAAHPALPDDPTAALQDLHPAQASLVQCHASQCGFCTPGFVMSLFALYHHRAFTEQPLTRQQAQEALSGNLCRCTGYRPILDAALAMDDLPRWQLDAQAVQAALARMPLSPRSDSDHLLAPAQLAELLRLRAVRPKAQLVAGCTDVGLWINKQHRQFAQVLDVTRTEALRRIEHYPHHIAIGAAVPLADAYDALVAERPQLHDFAMRFAGLPVRNSGTLGGNVANGSPIGDSMPLLIALGASAVLMRWHRGAVHHRELLVQDLYLGYRQTALQADEVLAWIKVPRPQPKEFLRVYKVSKRFDDDISAVCLALWLLIDGGVVREVRVGAGGVAATPARARRTEAALRGHAWTPDAVQRAMQVLAGEFTPISDMRASAAYRRVVLGQLLWRLWLHSQGQTAVDLEHLDLSELAGAGAGTGS